MPHDVLTSLQLPADFGQDKTPKLLENVCVLSDVCDQYFNFTGKMLSFSQTQLILSSEVQATYFGLIN